MKELTDQDLINNIQSNSEASESLSELTERHSGIYLDMVNAFSSSDSPFIDKNELINDKQYRIYKAAIKFDESRGAKFSTYLGNETKWMCLNIYNRNKRRPSLAVDFIDSIKTETHGQNNIDDFIEKDLFNKVLKIISSHPDKRVEKIFNMRYIVGSKNKVMPWKKIGNKLKLSIQGCINIHNSAVKYVNEELQGNQTK
jgi:DNA-directed RNA polymerase specialized sigma subunit